VSDDYDVRRLLENWPYDPDKNIRVLRGRDGRELLQVRLPLGLEQYELDGRPDAARPHGEESALHHHCARLAAAQAAGATSTFELSAEECEELFNEGALYYYRYLHCFQLRDWPRVVRDTGRNLKLFDFVHRYAEREEDQEYLEKWRPYLVRMNAAARALQELGQHNHVRALEIAREAVTQIEALEEQDEETFKYERQRSMAALRELIAQIERLKPVSKQEQMEKALRQAINAQEFERAAVLRDELRALRRPTQ